MSVEFKAVEVERTDMDGSTWLTEAVTELETIVEAGVGSGITVGAVISGLNQYTHMT